MKVIILAAGRGTRMGKYCRNLPKGMLPFNGKTLLEWQLKKLREAGLDEIDIITGYNHQAVRFPGVVYYHNPDYANTNMIESLLCDRELTGKDILVAYSDIIYTARLLRSMMDFDGEAGVAVDGDWRTYWMRRYGTTETDLESLVVDDRGRIREIGKPVESSRGIDYRYIGLTRFSGAGMKKALDIYHRKKEKNEPWHQSGKSFKQGYMTDILHEMIQAGTVVQPVVSSGGWLEFDTEGDYETHVQMLERGELSEDFF